MRPAGAEGGRTGWVREGEWLAYAPDGRTPRHRETWISTLQSAAELLAKRPRRALRTRAKRLLEDERVARVAADRLDEDADAFAYLPATP